MSFLPSDTEMQDSVIIYVLPNFDLLFMPDFFSQYVVVN